MLIAVAAAWSLKGPLAGALTAVLIGMSPFARVEASLIMSDGFAAGMTVLLIPLLLRPTPKRLALAGALAGALGGLLLRWVCPCPDGGPQAALSNLFFYPSVLLGLFWIFVPPLLPVVGMLYCWEHRDTLTARFTFWLTALSLLLFTFYFYQGARFMAAPVTLLCVFASAKLAGWMERGAGVRPAGGAAVDAGR